MGRSRLLVVLLALGTVGGFASGIRSVARHQYYKHHGDAQQQGRDCGGGWGGRGYGHGWNQQPQQPAVSPAPVVVEKVVEKRVEVPAAVTPTAAPTVNIYLNPNGAQPQSVGNTPTGDTQTR